jgi:peptidoglycan/LPS O-acetylase OafA/YrhL
MESASNTRSAESAATHRGWFAMETCGPPQKLTSLSIKQGRSGEMSLHYRPEIDGLRAVSVLSVVLFHSRIPGFTGGFIGVDVFFVISGFLITGIIFSEIKEKNFSIVRFYERRIRRIIPALSVVLLANIVAGYFILLPPERMGLSEAVTATALFASNLWVIVAGPPPIAPLLHTWTLAVEEQFYIAFPILMILLGNWTRYMLGTLLALAVFSLIGGLVLEEYHPFVASYGSPTRAWELLVGSILAIVRTPQNQKWQECASSVGLLAIIASVFIFHDVTSRAVAIAVLPVTGAAAFIYGGGYTVAGRLLSLKPIVWVGLISYSLYLWHWPILVFAKRTVGIDLSSPEMLACWLIMFAISVATWKWVEVPFRLKKPRGLPLFAGAMAALLIIAGYGCVAALAN